MIQGGEKMFGTDEKSFLKCFINCFPEEGSETYY